MVCRRHLPRLAKLWGSVSTVDLSEPIPQSRRPIASRKPAGGRGKAVRATRRPRRPLPPMQVLLQRTAALAYKELLAWALASVRISPRQQVKALEPANTFYVTSARRSLQ